MPRKPNTSNPLCPDCNRLSIKCGKHRSGKQKYKCPGCKKSPYRTPTVIEPKLKIKKVTLTEEERDDPLSNENITFSLNSIQREHFNRLAASAQLKYLNNIRAMRKRTTGH